MIYSATITLQPGTTAENAVKTLLEINKGLIWRIEVEFPAGCCGLVHLQIFDSSYQVFPATPGESLRGENVIVGYDDLYLKNAAPYELTLRAWNDDEVYEHTIQVRIGMATTEAFMSRYMPSITWDRFAETMARAAEQQETMKAEAIAKFQAEVGSGEEEQEQEQGQ